MKALLLLLFSLILFASCVKQTDIVENSSKIDHSLIIEVTKITNTPARLLAYGQLNFNEKFTIWKEHLTEWKNNYKLNKAQRDIIDEVLSYIKPEMWLNNSSKFAVANSENTAILQYTIKKNFSKVLAGQIFGSIENNSSLPPENEPSSYYSNNYYTCQCNVGSWVNQCSSEYPDCGSVNVCNQYGTYDCGFMSWFKCNGDCFHS